MEDMISKILELDRAAREDLKKANQMKIDSEKKISNTKERKRAEYIEKARISISNIEKEKADKKLKSIESFYKDKSQKIQKIYRENKEKLVQEIVDIVINK